jgi:hypothetical protein
MAIAIAAHLDTTPIRVGLAVLIRSEASIREIPLPGRIT